VEEGIKLHVGANRGKNWHANDPEEKVAIPRRSTHTLTWGKPERKKWARGPKKRKELRNVLPECAGRGGKLLGWSIARGSK